MRIRLYLDEDSMDQAVVAALRAAELDVLTAREAGMIQQSDDAHLAYATDQGRVLCTYNVTDFNRIHGEWLRTNRHHAGLILVVQQRYGPGEQARRLMTLASILSAEEMVDRAEFLSAWEQG